MLICENVRLFTFTACYFDVHVTVGLQGCRDVKCQISVKRFAVKSSFAENILKVHKNHKNRQILVPNLILKQTLSAQECLSHKIHWVIFVVFKLSWKQNRIH